MARKTTYTKQVADLILQQFACGEPIIQSCLDNGVKYSTFWVWINTNHDGLKERYDMARMSHAEHVGQSIIDMLKAPYTEDEKNNPQLAIAQRKELANHMRWNLEKRYRNMYGNHVTVENKHTIDLKPLLDRVRESIRAKGLKTVKAIPKATEKPLELTKLSGSAQSIAKPKKRI